ncbi:NifB/NifX family molybdenum-iron cluster-binding protein [Clostridium sp. D2Q-14]|uniref:NifB/NifX family molybdenum-iron cluster-binding protein n=1 Tax=Anaeromonas gelatinilytica TaxID=2683194 RepID=UPI00193C2F74|nr:NifB/NifX family molybdenum-iron cluster-binding protein [Anaeromonas gelatinilytica]MBS4534157.1 NifB/NifX family molybdenum-iron cluster-binding protein [Anaeromonas gelatinilytica]
MRIVIPVEEKSMGSNVSEIFGRTPYFLIYDKENKKEEFIENTASNSRGGAGIKAAQIVVDNKGDVLLTPQCGRNATDVIKGAEIKIYKTESRSVKENIEKFNTGTLLPLDNIHSGFHGHGEK